MHTLKKFEDLSWRWWS